MVNFTSKSLSELRAMLAHAENYSGDNRGNGTSIDTDRMRASYILKLRNIIVMREAYASIGPLSSWPVKEKE